MAEALAANWTCEWLQNYDWEVMAYHSCRTDLASLDPVRKLPGKQLAKKIDVEQAVTPQLYTLISYTLMNKPQCRDGTNAQMSMVTV